MKKKTQHIIDRIVPGSIAEEMEIEAGDELLEINGQPINDIFDYRFLIDDEYLEVVIRKPNGEEWELEIDKELDEDLGIEFDNGLMDDYKSCSNKCIFCFIDQMPPGMRETLYFKDDDTRLSFLQGNYVTLTNMKDKDIDRIIHYNMAPINISFQATNPELRCRMLHNRFAGDILKKVDRLYEAGLPMNGQIVLCKGWNDGKELERSLSDLYKYVPLLESVSVVPVGLSRFRDGLEPLVPFTKEDACEVIDTIERWQKKAMEEYNTHFIHASDEWYLLAERELPTPDNYDGYIQYENGVGMLRLLEEEVETALSKLKGDNRDYHFTVATGKLAASHIAKHIETVKTKYPNISGEVRPIRNDFFGEMITVAGLITGADLRAQLSDLPAGSNVLISENMLRYGEHVFLDDDTVEELENALQVKIHIVKSDGQALVNAIIGEDES